MATAAEQKAAMEAAATAKAEMAEQEVAMEAAAAAKAEMAEAKRKWEEEAQAVSVAAMGRRGSFTKYLRSKGPVPNTPDPVVLSLHEQCRLRQILLKGQISNQIPCCAYPGSDRQVFSGYRPTL